MVQNKNFESDLIINFNSQLFQEIIIPLKLGQKIIQESPDSVVIHRSGKSTANNNAKEIEQQYNEKYKPLLDYKFSTYETEYKSQIEFNTTQKYIEYADIRINEYVKNNVELDISCRIRRIS